jgi:hypothetical protein
MIILGFGFFVGSFSTGKAAPGPAIPPGLQVGRYQATFGSSNGNPNALKLLIWNSETGRGKLFQISDNITNGPITQLPMFPIE